MNPEELFTTALSYEEKIRDFYRTAEEKIDDQRGKSIFRALADDEQSHIDFLQYSLSQVADLEALDLDKLTTSIPSIKGMESQLDTLKAEIPAQMLGDIKTVLTSALKLEKETSTFYRGAYDTTSGKTKDIFKKFLDIEERHVDVVQIELDHAMKNGIWFNFMEIDLEAY